MARSRNLKPGFFLNDKLAELHPLARILFAGLWCVADREGRLPDNPRKFKIQILPYDDCDIDELLNDLAGSPEKFIIRYEVDGEKYIQITKFKDHQNPHKKEAPSIIPPPPVQAPGKNRERTGKEQGKNSSSPVISGTSPADSLNPLIDSLNPLTSFPAREKNRMAADDENIYELEELIEKYRRIPGIGEDQRDHAFFEALTDKYTCQDIRIAISELQITMVLQEVRKPLPYLRSILEGKNRPPPAPAAPTEKEEDEPEPPYYKRVADDDPDWLETKARLEAAEKELQKRDDTG